MMFSAHNQAKSLTLETSLMVSLQLVHKRLSRIESSLEQETVELTVQDAISAYTVEHLSKTKNPRSYKYLLSGLNDRFFDKQIADITPAELEDFIISTSDNPNTQAYRAIQLKGFYNWINRYLLKHGLPVIQNPMNALTFNRYHSKPKHVPTEDVKALIRASKSLRERLAVLVLATSGMRAGELAGLSVADIDGRVLTIRNPKSQRYDSLDESYTELAVIPESVSILLSRHISGLVPSDRAIGSYKYIYRVIRRLSKSSGLDLTPHDLRRWCATFWERQGEYSMVNFVLRHKGDRQGLGQVANAHYIAPLTPDEAMKCQDTLSADLTETEAL